MSKEKLSFKIPAMKVSQLEGKGQAIYIGKIKGEDFYSRGEERFKIDYWKRNPKTKKDDGYQRQFSDSAIQKLKNFILIPETPNPLFPTSILVNSRGSLNFKLIKGDFGYLDIDYTLYVIDGQHRFLAWRDMMEEESFRRKFGGYEFPIVVLSGFVKLKEIEQFFVINSRQKKIKTGLAQRNYLDLAAGKETSKLIPLANLWQLHATKIVDRLNEEIDGHWKGKIILPADSDDLRKAKIITQESFVSSLKPLFVGRDAYLASIKKNEVLERGGELLARFWEKVGNVYPHAVENPKDYSLMKTVGVFSLHIFLQDILSEESNDEKKAIEKAGKYISDAAEDELSEEFWKVKADTSAKEKGLYAGAYSSAVGHKKLALSFRMKQLL